MNPYTHHLFPSSSHPYTPSGLQCGSHRNCRLEERFESDKRVVQDLSKPQPCVSFTAGYNRARISAVSYEGKNGSPVLNALTQNKSYCVRSYGDPTSSRPFSPVSRVSQIQTGFSEDITPEGDNRHFSTTIMHEDTFLYTNSQSTPIRRYEMDHSQRSRVGISVSPAGSNCFFDAGQQTNDRRLFASSDKKTPFSMSSGRQETHHGMLNELSNVLLHDTVHLPDVPTMLVVLFFGSIFMFFMSACLKDSVWMSILALHSISSAIIYWRKTIHIIGLSFCLSITLLVTTIMDLVYKWNIYCNTKVIASSMISENEMHTESLEYGITSWQAYHVDDNVRQGLLTKFAVVLTTYSLCSVIVLFLCMLAKYENKFNKVRTTVEVGDDLDTSTNKTLKYFIATCCRMVFNARYSIIAGSLGFSLVLCIMQFYFGKVSQGVLFILGSISMVVSVSNYSLPNQFVQRINSDNIPELRTITAMLSVLFYIITFGLAASDIAGHRSLTYDSSGLIDITPTELLNLEVKGVLQGYSVNRFRDFQVVVLFTISWLCFILSVWTLWDFRWHTRTVEATNPSNTDRPLQKLDTVQEYSMEAQQFAIEDDDISSSSNTANGIQKNRPIVTNDYERIDQTVQVYSMQYCNLFFANQLTLMVNRFVCMLYITLAIQERIIRLCWFYDQLAKLFGLRILCSSILASQCSKIAIAASRLPAESKCTVIIMVKEYGKSVAKKATKLTTSTELTYKFLKSHTTKRIRVGTRPINEMTEKAHLPVYCVLSCFQPPTSTFSTNLIIDRAMLNCPSEKSAKSHKRSVKLGKNFSGSLFHTSSLVKLVSSLTEEVKLSKFGETTKKTLIYESGQQVSDGDNTNSEDSQSGKVQDDQKASKSPSSSGSSSINGRVLGGSRTGGGKSGAGDDGDDDDNRRKLQNFYDSDKVEVGHEDVVEEEETEKVEKRESTADQEIELQTNKDKLPGILESSSSENQNTQDTPKSAVAGVEQTEETDIVFLDADDHGRQESIDLQRRTSESASVKKDSSDSKEKSTLSGGECLSYQTGANISLTQCNPSKNEAVHKSKKVSSLRIFWESLAQQEPIGSASLTSPYSQDSSATEHDCHYSGVERLDADTNTKPVFSESVESFENTAKQGTKETVTTSSRVTDEDISNDRVQSVVPMVSDNGFADQGGEIMVGDINKKTGEMPEIDKQSCDDEEFSIFLSNAYSGSDSVPKGIDSLSGSQNSSCTDARDYSSCRRESSVYAHEQFGNHKASELREAFCSQPCFPGSKVTEAALDNHSFTGPAKSELEMLLLPTDGEAEARVLGRFLGELNHVEERAKAPNMTSLSPNVLQGENLKEYEADEGIPPSESLIKIDAPICTASQGSFDRLNFSFFPFNKLKEAFMTQTSTSETVNAMCSEFLMTPQDETTADFVKKSNFHQQLLIDSTEQQYEEWVDSAEQSELTVTEDANIEVFCRMVSTEESQTKGQVDTANFPNENAPCKKYDEDTSSEALLFLKTHGMMQLTPQEEESLEYERLLNEISLRENNSVSRPPSLKQNSFCQDDKGAAVSSGQSPIPHVSSARTYFSSRKSEQTVATTPKFSKNDGLCSESPWKYCREDSWLNDVLFDAPEDPAFVGLYTQSIFPSHTSKFAQAQCSFSADGASTNLITSETHKLPIKRSGTDSQHTAEKKHSSKFFRSFTHIDDNDLLYGRRHGNTYPFEIERQLPCRSVTFAEGQDTDVDSSRYNVKQGNNNSSAKYERKHRGSISKTMPSQAAIKKIIATFSDAHQHPNDVSRYESQRNMNKVSKTAKCFSQTTKLKKHLVVALVDTDRHAIRTVYKPFRNTKHSFNPAMLESKVSSIHSEECGNIFTHYSPRHV